MGLFDKIKGILFDEEEIEIPEIKNEHKKSIVTTKEDENPIRELKIPKDDFKDSEYKSDTTFTFPIDFDDEEPIKIEEIESKDEIHKTEPKREVRKETYRDTYSERDFSDFLKKKESSIKKFTPTPIISPVYGVLDQNYKKEDVIVKNEVLRDSKEPTLETVRKKAFGSLEDDLEANLTKTKEIKIKEEVTAKKTKKTTPKTEKVEEPVNKLKTIGELINEDEHSLEIPEIDSINVENEEYNNDIEEVTNNNPTKSVDDLISNEEKEEVKEEIIENDAEIDEEEADLFSLIDSMYEEKGE